MDLKLLRDKNFLLLMQGKFTSMLGSGVQAFALSLFVLNEYQSTSLFASVLVVSIIPRLLLSPIAGVFVDWFNRKKIIVSLDLLSSGLVFLTALYYMATGSMSIIAIYAITIALSLIKTLFAPAIETVIPTIMEDEDLFSANAMDRTLSIGAEMIAPILASMLYGFFGLGIIFLINGISFLLSAISELFIIIPNHTQRPEKISYKAFKKDFGAGVAVIKNSQALFIMMIASLAINFAFSPVFSVTLPHILKKVMMVSDVKFGLFETFVIGAAFVGSALAGFISKKFDLRTIMFYDLHAQPIITALLGLLTTSAFLGLFSNFNGPYVLLTVLTCIAFMLVSIGNIAMSTVFQRLIPKESMGRIFTVFSTMSMGAIPLGQALSGLLLDVFPVWVNLGLSSIILYVAVRLSFKALSIEKDGKTIFDQLSITSA